MPTHEQYLKNIEYYREYSRNLDYKKVYAKQKAKHGFADKFSPEHIAKIVAKKKGMKYDLKEENPTWIKKGQRLSPETEFKKGLIPWNKGTGRREDYHGYIRVYYPEHPYADRFGYVYEHRLVAEKILGRYLKPEEIVHHINGVRDDNRPQNFVICSQAYHVWLESNFSLDDKLKLGGRL